MQARRVGASGLRVSPLGLGTWMWGTHVPDDVCRDLLATYLEAGGTLLDTAHGYGAGRSEELVGSLLTELGARDDVVLTTKAGISAAGGQRAVDVSRGALLRQLDASLARLGVDAVDVWLVHTWSDETPLAETLGALEHAVVSGRTRYVGVSNYSGWQSARAFSLLESARIPLLANQVEYSLLERDAEYDAIPAAVGLGYGVLAHSPLAGGILSGKYRSGVPADSRAAMREFPGFTARIDARAVAVAEAVATAAAGLEVSPTEVALAWVRNRPGVSAALLGSRTLGQLNVALASSRLTLPDEIVAALDEVSA